MSGIITQEIARSLLPTDAQTYLAIWELRMERLTSMGKGMTRFAREICGEWGVSFPTLMRLKKRYEDSGVMGLLDQRKWGKYLEGESKGLPLVFVEDWKKRQEKLQRGQTIKHAWRCLIDDLLAWRKGDTSRAIPGYDAPPRNQPGTLFPAGWGYENLTRHQPDVAELAMARQGRSAAKKHLAKVYTTRFGIEPGQVLMVDDQWDDVLVAWNCGQTARPLRFDLMDFGCGVELLDGAQPRLEDEDGKKMGLKEDDVFWLILTHFVQNGYRADLKTHCIVERGTATLRAEVARGLFAATGGKIIVDKGGVDNRAVKGLLFDGPARGNFRFKASRESLFALRRTLMAALPAQAGRNKDEAPEEAGAIVKYVQRLFESVPQERWHLLRLPMLTQEQYYAICADLKQSLNHRRWHTLEGWDRLGYMESVYRLPGSADDEWIPLSHLQARLLTLPIAQAEELSLAIAMGDEKLIHRLPKSPQMVWDEHKHKLTKLSMWAYSQVIPARMAHIRPVSSQEIHIHGVGSEMLRYDARVKDLRGHYIMLTQGREYMVFVNPHLIDEALVCDLHGAAIGVMTRIIPFTRIDVDAFHSRMGVVKSMHAPVEAAVARLAEGKAKDRADMVKHNERVRKFEPITLKEIANHRSAKKAGRDLAASEEAIIADMPAMLPRQDQEETVNPFEV